MTSVRYKVLLVEDDRDSLETCKGLLEAEGFSVFGAGSASEAFARAAESEPDLVLSDVAMPETDGRQLVQQLRADRRTAGLPVILMSGSYREEADQAEGLEAGADDYLPKPFSPQLLAARIRAVLRRYSAPKDLGEQLKAEGLVLDVAARTVTFKGRLVPLTRKEFDLLTTFLRRPGRVLSVPYLLETVWGYDPADYNDPRTVAVHISSLRKKVGTGLGRRLVAVAGVGYRLDS